MPIRRFLLASLFAIVAACGGKTTTPPPAQPSNTPAADEPAAVAKPTPAGKWREFWGVPGETDVTYHDEYEVGYHGDKPYVLPQNQDQPDEIGSVTINGDDFDLVIQTSFEVHYKLHLDPGGATMTGTATTPDRTVPIRWERITE